MQYIICSGGIGDALLGVAESFRLDKCMLIHAANRYNRETIEEFVKPFNIPHIILNGALTPNLFSLLSNQPNCLSTCHLPDKMDYVEWTNKLKYEPKIPIKLPVQELFGKFPSDRPLIAVVPAGSNIPPTISTPYGIFHKNRIINSVETVALANKFLNNYTVILIGDHEHEELVYRVNNPHCFWVSSEYVLDYHGNRAFNSASKLYAMLNSCEHVYSVDTWVKTYSCYANIPTTVIRTRFNNGYPDALLDLSENIFLNHKLWNLTIKTIENIIDA